METKIKTRKIHKEKIYYVKEMYCDAPCNWLITDNYKKAASSWAAHKATHPLTEIWIEEKIITINRIDIYEEPF